MYSKKQIDVAGLTVELTRKRIKNIYLRVVPPLGKIHASAPMRVSEKYLREFILARVEWIKDAQTEIQNRPTTIESALETGATVYFLGERLTVNIQTAKRSSINMHNRILEMHISDDATETQKVRLFDNWYRKHMRIMLPDMITHWEKIIGVQSNSHGIKKMKTKWGSCNIQAKRIWLGLELMKYPQDCLEYVVVHELVHLLERYHNTRFYALMDTFLPAWKESELKLKGGYKINSQ